MEKILIVEDEKSLAVGLEFNINKAGYQVEVAGDGRQALELFKKGDFDLIILDVMLPYVDGFEVAKKVRKEAPQIPILILSARTDSQDRIHGLKIGADDYMTKPFNLEELMICIEGMLKRKKWYKKILEQNAIYSFGKNIINFADFTCTSEGKEFQLTYLEAMVLKYLIDNKNRNISRIELIENIWQMDVHIETRTVDNFIVRLRKYFEPVPEKPIYIISVRGVGYIFRDPAVN